MKRLKIHDIFRSYRRVITEYKNADSLAAIRHGIEPKGQGSMLGK